ncbi:hypothetical protein BC940DRAFT_311393 [Gongronella butleri]|nr:hypothetical protein BC940DRAFT_311393 [Gongronella butleri]
MTTNAKSMDAPLLTMLPEEILCCIFVHVHSRDLLHHVRLVNSVCHRVATPLAFSRHTIHISRRKALLQVPDVFGPSVTALTAVQSLSLDLQNWEHSPTRAPVDKGLSAIDTLVDENHDPDETFYENEDGAYMSDSEFDEAHDYTNATGVNGDENDALEGNLLGFSTISRVFPCIRSVTLKAPRRRRNSAHHLRLLEYLEAQLRLLPLLEHLDAGMFSQAITTWTTLLPAQLTDVSVTLSFSLDGPSNGSMTLVASLLNQLPQLTSLQLDRLANTHMDNMTLERWVYNVMEGANKQYANVKYLNLGFFTMDRSDTAFEHGPLLVFIYFTFPALTSLVLRIPNTNLIYPANFWPREGLPPSLVTLCNFPKRITISDISSAPFNSDTETIDRDSRWYIQPMASQQPVERVTLYAHYAMQAMHWLDGCPTVGIKALSLQTYRGIIDQRETFALLATRGVIDQGEAFQRLLSLVPQLEQLQIKGYIPRQVNRVGQRENAHSDVFETQSRASLTPNTAKWEFVRCNFATPLCVHRLMEACSHSIDLDFFHCEFYSKSTELCETWLGETPWAAKLAKILDYDLGKMALLSLPASNLKLTLWPPKPCLYIVLQDQQYVKDESALRVFLGFRQTDDLPYELAHAETEWVMHQIDRISEAGYNGVSRRQAVNSFPASELGKHVWDRIKSVQTRYGTPLYPEKKGLAEYLWKCLIDRKICVIRCFSLDPDNASIFAYL